MNQLTRIPLMIDRTGAGLIPLADEQLRLYGSVTLGAAQAETFLRARPASRMEATENPKLFRVSRHDR